MRWDSAQQQKEHLAPQQSRQAIDSSSYNDENSLQTYKHMLVDVESMTEGVHYIRDKASPRGHESERANIPFLEQNAMNRWS
jgi:hypothetical protein